MYGLYPGIITQYTLSTEWDISTLSIDGTFTISTIIADYITGRFAISEDGKYMILAGMILAGAAASYSIFRIDTSTPWDFLSPTYNNITFETNSAHFTYGVGIGTYENTQYVIGISRTSTQLQLSSYSIEQQVTYGEGLVLTDNNGYLYSDSEVSSANIESLKLLSGNNSGDQDLSGLQILVPTAVEDNVAIWDSTGQTKDSGIAISKVSLKYSFTAATVGEETVEFLDDDGNSLSDIIDLISPSSNTYVVTFNLAYDGDDSGYLVNAYCAENNGNVKVGQLDYDNCSIATSEPDFVYYDGSVRKIYALGAAGKTRYWKISIIGEPLIV
jgi:hypothetical protein